MSASRGVRRALDRAADRDRLAPARECAVGVLGGLVLIEAAIVLALVLLRVG